MADLDLTDRPLSLTVSLTRRSDFVRIIKPQGSTTFVAGTEIELDFGDGDVWPAVVTPNAATWVVDKVVSDLLFLKSPSQVALLYRQGSVDRVWGLGSVELYGD